MRFLISPDGLAERARTLLDGVLEGFRQLALREATEELGLEADPRAGEVSRLEAHVELRDELTELIVKHAPTIATGGADFAFSIVRGLALEDGSLDHLDLAALSDGDLMRFSLQGAQIAAELRAQIVAGRAALVADLKQVGGKVARGALSAVLVALMA
jgi:8-oxo-dGTP pyrophosphatase MutT (NUDIX family)